MHNNPSLNLSLSLSWHSIPSPPFLPLLDFPISILPSLELLILHLQFVPLEALGSTSRAVR